MDIINKRKQQFGMAPASAQTMAEQTQQTATGKVGRGGATPAISNVEAQLAAQAGQAQQAGLAAQQAGQMQALGQQERMIQQQQDLAGRQQAQQLQQQQQQLLAQQNMADQQRAAQEQMAAKELKARDVNNTKQLNNAYANALADLASQRNITEQNLFEYARQERDKLGLEKSNAFLEQVAHAMALADRKYVDTLVRLGEENNLRDELNFKKEAMKTAFGNDFDILSQQLDMQALMNADARESKQLLAKMDINAAIQLAEQAAKEEAYKNIITGGVGFATQYATYSQMKDKNPSETGDLSLGEILLLQP